MTNDNSFATRYAAETEMLNQRNGTVMQRDWQTFIHMLNTQMLHGNITAEQHRGIMAAQYPTYEFLDAMHQVLQNRKHNGLARN